MRLDEAKKIRDEFMNNANPSEDQVFLFTEAMEYLIEEEKNPEDMAFLGGVYYEMKNFDLALKYYEMAASFNYVPIYECLGYIWYYGRTGKVDYKKAYKYFNLASKHGDFVAKYKIADMYKNGYYVKKDQEKYEKIIEELYYELEEYKDSEYINPEIPIPEINTRLAKIKEEHGDIDQAIDLYLEGKLVLEKRIKANSFFGNLNIMMDIIDSLYNIKDFDNDDFDFYDLYYLLKEEHIIRFWYDKKEYVLESVKDGEECAVKFNNKWFYNREDFFGNAVICNKKLINIYDNLYGFEVIK